MESCKKSRIVRKKRQSTEEDGFKFFTNLPVELLMNILSRLSIKSIFRCRFVCKEWLRILLTHDFAKLHFSRAPTCPLLHNPTVKSISESLYLLEIERDRLCYICDDDNRHRKKTCASYYREYKKHVNMEISTRFLLPNLGWCKFRVVNSCNGLLCLEGPLLKDPIVIYNPVTSEYIILPCPIAIEDKSAHFFVAGGLGFCQIINKFKVLAMIPEKKLALVYTFGSGIWRTVGIAPDVFRDGLWNTTFLNGALHWLVGDYKFKNSLILYFDLDDERFKTILPPWTMNRYYQLHPNHADRVLQDNYLDWSAVHISGGKKKWIGVLRDQIFICDSALEYQPYVWALKDYGDQQSWFQIFELPSLPSGLYQPIELLEDVGLLLHEANNAFLICGRYRFRYFKIRGFRTKFEVTPHIPSFLSLKDVVGDNMEVLTVSSESLGKTSQLHLVEENWWNSYRLR